MTVLAYSATRYNLRLVICGYAQLRAGLFVLNVPRWTQWGWEVIVRERRGSGRAWCRGSASFGCASPRAFTVVNVAFDQQV
jgi:hypothetical protein